MKYENIEGVPNFECTEYENKKHKYCLCIPIINEKDRIKRELEIAKTNKVSDYVDIIICDGDSTDGCTDEDILKSLSVNTLLVKKDIGKQGAQLRMGFYFALKEDMKGL